MSVNTGMIEEEKKTQYASTHTTEAEKKEYDFLKR
jgi:hypothetical protein